MFKYTKLMTRLLKEIRETTADTKLPSRQELCSQYQCTRTTIDRAIKELTAQGYLYSHQGSGTYVASTEFSNPQITHTWGLIVPNIQFQLYSSMLRGVADVANKNGISVQIFNTDNEPSKQRHIIRNLVKLKINGLLIVPNTVTEPQYEIFFWLKSQNIPFVFCNRGVEEMVNAPLVCSNSFYGGYLATKHLFEKGYKNPAIITSRFYRLPMDRMQGYLAAVSEQGIKLNRDQIVYRCGVPQAADQPLAYSETRKLLELKERPDSIFCSSEHTLAGVYKAVQDAGLKIPDDIGVISHDNSPMCLQHFPHVTAVTLDCYQIGHHAAILLEKLMKGEEAPDFNIHVLQPELVIRQSCLGPGRG